MEAETYLTERYAYRSANGEKVGVDSAALRQITGTIVNGARCECVLDQGCTIIAMRKDVWIQLGLAL